MASEAHPHWLSYRWRMILLGVLAASLPLTFIAYSVHWMRQRREFDERKYVDVQGVKVLQSDERLLFLGGSAPLALRWLGEPGVSEILCDPDKAALARRLFPEAEVSEFPPWTPPGPGVRTRSQREPEQANDETASSP